MSRSPSVQLGDVLTPARDAVRISPTDVYDTAGIYSFGRGLFRKTPISGAETSYRSFNKLLAGRFVYSRLFAWEGAVAVVTPDFDGLFVSTEFPVFDIVAARLLPEYLSLICKWPEFHDQLARSATGLGLRRQRVYEDALLALEIPLPPIDEQRRIAAWIDRLASQSDRVRQLADRRTALTSAFEAVVSDYLFAMAEERSWAWARLGGIAEVNPPPSKVVGDGVGVTFVPMRAVDDRTGEITGPERRSVEEVSRGYKQFRSGDVIFARITPCMQNGKSAVASGLESEIAFGSTEFHVIRSSGSVLPEWIHRIVRSHRFRSAAAARFSGTAGQQRVPVDYLETAEIPVPETTDEQRVVLQEHDAVINTLRTLLDRHGHQRQVLDALQPSILNAVFDDQN